LSRRRAAFLDRDGTLNRRAPAHGYVRSPVGFVWLAGAREGVRRLNDEGWLVLVVTNQRGIARGLYTAADVEAIHANSAAGAREIGAQRRLVLLLPARRRGRLRVPLSRRPGLILPRRREGTSISRVAP
jgi:HAD superfamily hydrolase (TIGR01662 family)